LTRLTFALRVPSSTIGTISACRFSTNDIAIALTLRIGLTTRKLILSNLQIWIHIRREIEQKRMTNFAVDVIFDQSQ
jgi:hypothetical protein